MFDPTHFRPLGNRVLVRRYSLPEQSAGGLYVLGRDYPTMGKLLMAGRGDKMRELWSVIERCKLDELQWEVKANYETRSIGPDLLILDFDDINLLVTTNGRAMAVGDRALIEPQPHDSNLLLSDRRYDSIMALKPQYKWQLGLVHSTGWLIDEGDILSGDHIVFDRNFASQIQLGGRDYFVVRERHCELALEA